MGKTSLARIMAKSLNCEKGPTDEPCGTCKSCTTIADGSAVDVIEIDGASNNSVDDIRELRETVPYRPIIGRFKIYVIDEVHMLSVSAFNALLKTLEEPPAHVKFIFATTEPHKIPTTILSRIQRYDFRRISTSAIIGRIKEILQEEGIHAEDAALAIVGREADGSMRDALSVLDQVLAAGEKNISAEYVASLLGVVGRQTYFELSAAIVQQNTARCLEIIQDIDRQGFDIPTFSKGLLEHLRNLVVAAVCEDDIDFLELPQEELTELRSQAQATSRDTLHRMFKHISQAYEEIARSAFPKILLEATVARVADLGELVPASELVRRIELLSQQMSSGNTGVGNPANAHGSTTPSQPPVKKKSSDPVTPSNTSEIPPAYSSQNSSQPPTNRPSNAPATPAPSSPPERLSSDDDASTPPQHHVPDAASFGTSKSLIKSEWESLLSKLAQKMPAKSSLLERANFSPHSTTSEIVIHFDKSDAFTASQAQDRTVIHDLETFFSECLQTPVQLKIEVRDLGNQSTMAQKKLKSQEELRQKQETAKNHPLIRSFESALGGKISKVRLNR